MSVTNHTNVLKFNSSVPTCPADVFGRAISAPFYPSPLFTCFPTQLPSIFSKVEIASYNALSSYPEVPRSKFELAARKIQPQFHWKLEGMHEKEANEKKILDRFRLYSKAATEYLKQARLPLPAADRAILLHQAHTALKDQMDDFGIWNHEENQVESQIEELRFEEASACLEAATLTDNPYEKFSFMLKGILQLPNVPRDDRIPTSSYHKHQEAFIKQCSIAEEIWSSLANLVLSSNFNFQEIGTTMPREFNHMWKPVDGHYSKEFFAGHCFLNAARVAKDHAFQLDSGEHFYKQAYLYSTKARDQFKVVSTLLDVVLEANNKKLILTHVEEQILEACHGRFHMQGCLELFYKSGKIASTAEYVEQAIRTADKLAQLAETQNSYNRAYSLLKQSRILDFAARHTSNLKVRFQLAEKALQTVLEATRLNPNICKMNSLCKPYFLDNVKDLHAKARDAHIKNVIKQKKTEGMLCRIKRFISKRF